MLLLGIFIALQSVSCDNPCGIKKQTPLDYDKTVKCLTSIPLTPDSEEVKDTIESLIELVNLHVFIDITHNPPYPHEKLAANLTSKLEDISTKTYGNTNEFYSAVSNIFLELLDPHCVFVKPCASSFEFVLPYALKVETPTEDIKDAKLFFIDLPQSYASVAETYHNEGNDNLSGYEILKISVDGTEFLDETAVVSIGNWASKEVFNAKLLPARFNAAIRTRFWNWPQRLNRIPPNKIRVLVKKGDAEPKEVSIPYYGWALKDVEHLVDVCPPLPKDKQPNARKETNLNWHRAMQRMVTEDTAHPTTPSSNQIPNGDALKPIIQAKDVQLYHDDKLKTGYLRLPSFYPQGVDDDHEAIKAYVKGVVDSFEKMKELETKRLVVDVRGNGGGYVALGMRTLQYISNYLSPIIGRYDIRHTPIYEKLDELKLLSNVSRFTWPDNKTISESEWYSPGKNKTFKLKDGKDLVQEYSKQYTVEIYDDEVVFEGDYKVLIKGAPVQFDPQHLIFLTDGLCGSTCSCFIKRASEGRAGRIIGLGRNPAFPEAEFDVGAFAGGSVQDTDWLWSYVKEHPSLSTVLPKGFYREGSRLRWALEEIYSSDFDTKDELLEFKVNKPDFQIGHTPIHDEYSIERLEDVYSKVLPFFDICAAGEVRIDSACTSPINYTEPDQRLWGRPCESGKFNENKCVFARCADRVTWFGDKEKIDGVEVPICNPNAKPEAKSKGFRWEFYGPIIAAGGTVIIAAIVITCICMCRRKKKPDDGAGEYSKM